MAAGVGIASILFSVRYITPENQRVYYHPLFHLLLAGVTGAFLTGDLFNLFVWFEVMLIVSYVFVAFYGTDYATAASFRYLVMNVFGSALMLVAIGGLYATTGTLNMADMARRLATPDAYGIDPAPVVGLSALLLAVFALKSGLVPFQFWVPAAYTAAPTPVTAMFAGVTKKVGIYAIIRLYFTVFATASVPVDLLGTTAASPLAFLAPVLGAMGWRASSSAGSAPSVRTDSSVFAYSSIGQVGFIAVPVAIAAAAATGTLRGVAIAAALVFALHHALAKGLLFLSVAAVEDATKTDRLRNLGGVAGHSPVLSGTVFVGLLSLIGLPPLTGFLREVPRVRRGDSGNCVQSRLAAVGARTGRVAPRCHSHDPVRDDARVGRRLLGARDDSGRDRFRRVGSGRGSRRTRGGHRSRRRGVRPGLPVRRDGDRRTDVEAYVDVVGLSGGDGA